MIWQQKARMTVGFAGVAFAGVVFLARGTREKHVVPPPPQRLDQAAIVESSGADVRQVRGVKEDYEIKSQRQLLYADHTSKSLDVEIHVRGRDGRDFTMTAKEARGGANNSTVAINGAVVLTASDGFVVTTDHATFNDADGLVRAEGPLAFHRGDMSGTGVGMTYDKNKDILSIVNQAHVQFVDSAGAVTMDFSGGRATLSRVDHVLFVEGNMHALRGGQQMDAGTGRAQLTEKDDAVTAVALRGDARVAGGSAAFDAMSANDIDLDYNQDGSMLERVLLSGHSAIALAGQGGSPGRQFFGDTLTVGLSGGNAVTSVVGQEHVRLDMPAAKGTPRRSVQARLVDARSKSGTGLESAKFSEQVQFQEDPPTPGTPPRLARSRMLDVVLTGDSISNAVFVGSVTFTENHLRASAARAEYEPDAGTLRLVDADQGGGPNVEDAEVTVKADAIDVTLPPPGSESATGGHRMTARGNITTLLQGQTPGADGKMPGLFKRDQVAHVKSADMHYESGKGRAIYTGDVQLWQDNTTVRADRITIDRDTGDLTATGSARTSMPMDKGASLGRAHEIQYVDAKREIEYRGAAPAAVTTKALAQAVQLSGPEGDVRADRILVALQGDTNEIDRLEGFGHVSLKLDARLATGTRLTYFAADERYVTSATSGALVTVVEPCRETHGKVVTFFKATDRIIVDGNEEGRTHTKSASPSCQQTTTH
jgi:lipopolysaccharide transport protein LptA